VKQLVLAFIAGAGAAIGTSLALVVFPTPSGIVSVALFALLCVVSVAFAAGWGVFGREFALIGLAWCGAWVAWSGGVFVRFLTDDTTDLLVGSIFVLFVCVGGFFATWFTWMIGTLVCGGTGHYTSKELSEIAAGRDRPLTVALRRTLDELTDEVGDLAAHGRRITARSLAIERRRTWRRPALIVATDRELIVAPLDDRGVVADDVLTVSSTGLATGSVRSLDRNGATRRSLSHHDDLIEITTTDGRSRRVTLAYQPRRRRAQPGTVESTGEPEIGGADAIRNWVRVHAATYH
jgi:hypothetical protein